MKPGFFLLLFALSLSPLIASAQTTNDDQRAFVKNDWAAWGGTVGVYFSESNLRGMGIRIDKRVGRLAGNAPRLTDALNVRQALDSDLFALRESSSIQFRAHRGTFDGFLGGSLQSRGGYTLKLDDDNTIALVDFRLRPNADNPMRLDVVSADGKAWFYVKKPMYELVNDNHILAIYTADMHVTPALAARSGHPEMADAPIGDLEILTQVSHQGSGGVMDFLGTPSPSHWHGDQVVGQPPGVVYKTDLFMQNIFVSKVRDQNVGGPNGNGRVVFAPQSDLRNNVNNGTAHPTVAGQGALGTSSALFTAWIPWYQKFSGIFPPYGNDQHPFLIWNMYRINADGGIEQIGRSGVKHAWLTTNHGCADGEMFDPHVLGRSCDDNYTTFNNDKNQDLTERSEIIPATVRWGRCYSIFDPNCVGSNTNPTPNDDQFERRLVVNESQISNTVNPGARYLFDSWYLARGDINIYNSMATISGTPMYSSGNWSFSGQSNFMLGSVTGRWMENLPANTLATQNVELSVDEGHVKVAVRVVDAGGGKRTYHYAVHNLDYARIVASGSEPNLRVVSNKGFKRFRVAVPAAVSVISSRFSDGDLIAGNNWHFSNDGTSLSWTAPSGTSLDWGTLYLFSVTTIAEPVFGNSQLTPALGGAPAIFNITTLVPAASDVIFKSGFESL